MRPGLFTRPDRIGSKLDVLTVVFNPARFRSRWSLFEKFRKYVEDTGEARLWVVEVAFGERDFAVAEEGNPRHLRLRSDGELWLKENALNLLLHHACSTQPDVRYVAWVDADVVFVRPDWVGETLHQLQRWPIVQMFSEAVDLNSHFECVQDNARVLFRSFAASMLDGIPWSTGSTYGAGHTPAPPPYKYMHHPGFAWAARRQALDSVGGLFDLSVVGEADYIMARALAGAGLSAVNPKCSPAYKAAVSEWQERARRAGLVNNLGVVRGLLLHNWHGPKARRKYWERTSILADTGYDPHRDVIRDSQGLYQITSAKPELRNLLRSYFRQRNEDAPSED